MSHAPATLPAARDRAPRGPDLAVVRRAVARLTLPVLLLLPAVIIIGGLVGYPLVKTIWLSFTETRLGDLSTAAASGWGWRTTRRCSPTSTCGRR